MFFGGRPQPRSAPAPETITPNDNRSSAGHLDASVLTIRLEARTGTWYPEGPSGSGLQVAAWGEPGKPLLNPGPVIRVRAGTTVRASITNSLDKPLTVFGLGASRTPRASGNLSLSFGGPPFVGPNAPQSAMPIRVR